MRRTPKIHRYQNLTTLTRKLRSDVKDAHCVVLYAYNRTGKTRLSMEFKNQGKRKGNGTPDTLYFNAYTEDRSGPRIVDSVLSEISTGFQAAVFTATCSKYTASGVRRSSAVCRRRVL